MSDYSNRSSRTIATAVTIVLAILVVMLAASQAYTIVMLTKQGDDLHGVVESIQTERVRNTGTSCEAQNARNVVTTRRLRSMTDDPGARALASGLIDALVPIRDCEAVVRRQTGLSTP